MKLAELKKNFKKKVLKNGITLLFEKRNIPSVSVVFCIKSGAAYESKEEKGIHHFIEHMLFKGTKKRNYLQISEEIENTGGGFNGFTSEVSTAYSFAVPSEDLTIGLDVLSDMLNNSTFLEEEIEKEKKIVIEEIKGVNDDPESYVMIKSKEMMYSHPFGLEIGGDEETVNSFTREQIIKKWKEEYFSKNLIVSVVGDCDFDYLVNFLEKNFEKREGKISKKKIMGKNKEKIETRKGLTQANLSFGIHFPLSNEKNFHASAVLGDLMTAGMSSRLFKEIREKRGLAYGVSGEQVSTRNFSMYEVFVGCEKKDVDLVKKLILEEFKKVAEKLSAKEFKKVKKRMIGGYKIYMEDSEDQADDLADDELDDKAEERYLWEEKISKVKLKDVKELASKVKEGNYSFFALVPEDKES